MLSCRRPSPNRAKIGTRPGGPCSNRKSRRMEAPVKSKGGSPWIWSPGHAGRRLEQGQEGLVPTESFRRMDAPVIFRGLPLKMEPGHAGRRLEQGQEGLVPTEYNSGLERSLRERKEKREYPVTIFPFTHLNLLPSHPQRRFKACSKNQRAREHSTWTTPRIGSEKLVYHVTTPQATKSMVRGICHRFVTVLKYF